MLASVIVEHQVSETERLFPHSYLCDCPLADEIVSVKQKQAYTFLQGGFLQGGFNQKSSILYFIFLQFLIENFDSKLQHKCMNS